MSKKILRLIPVLALSIVMVLGMTLSASAESYDFTDEDYHCYFGKDHKMDTNFTAETIAKRVEDLQPGDDLTFAVKYKNNASERTDWYMENAIEQTLEKTKAAKKVRGTGKAENGGYTYELLHYDKNGNQKTLFNSYDKVLGGTERPIEGREGLEEATNALEDWFFIQTLDPGESGTVVLKVAFEGETEVNDYMDTDGGLNVRFAVELPDEGNTPPPPVKTGDYTNITRWVALMMGAGVLLLIIAVFSVKRDREDRKEAYDEKH